MKVSLRVLSLLSILSVPHWAHAQAPTPEGAALPPPSNLPPDAAGTAAPLPSEPTAPANPLPAAEVPAPSVVEESIDPALLGAAGGSGQLSAEELEKLGFGGGSPSVDTAIKVFGFADFTMMASPRKPSDAWRKAISPHASFYIGNFNLYVAKNLSQNVRMMSEVRFHYSPLGTANPDGSYNLATGADPADFGRTVKLGGIEIQRIYLEWQIHRYLSVRAGQFLTPYGIWNVDHGSPLFIPVTRPYVIGSQLFPQRQTGLEFLGQYDVGNDSTLGYHFTISNGMGSLQEIKDLDNNKGVGGRVFWEFRKLGTLRLGGSGFYATDTSATSVRGINAAGRLTQTENIQSQSNVLSLAADLQWKYKGWHVQSEVITQQRKYTSKGRVAAPNPLTGTRTFPEDYLSWGVYGLLGYGFDVFTDINIMPYMMVQSFDQLDATLLRTKTNGLTVGLNIRPIDSVVVKLNYVMSKWPDGYIISNSSIQLLEAQVAWAF